MLFYRFPIYAIPQIPIHMSGVKRTRSVVLRWNLLKRIFYIETLNCVFFIIKKCNDRSIVPGWCGSFGDSCNMKSTYNKQLAVDNGCLPEYICGLKVVHHSTKYSPESNTRTFHLIDLCWSWWENGRRDVKTSPNRRSAWGRWSPVSAFNS